MKISLKLLSVILSVLLITSSLPFTAFANEEETETTAIEETTAYQEDFSENEETTAAEESDAIEEDEMILPESNENVQYYQISPDTFGVRVYISGDENLPEGAGTYSLGDGSSATMPSLKDNGFAGATSDTYISSANPNTNYGNSADAYASANHIALFKSPLPQTAAHAELIDAYLHVACSFNDTTNSVVIGAYTVACNWDEMSWTWNLANQQQRLGLISPKISDITISDSTGFSVNNPVFVNIEITDAAKAWEANPNTNFGIGLRRVSGSTTPVIFKTSQSSYEYFPYFEYIYKLKNSYEDGTYFIKNVATEKFMDVEGPSTSEGAIIQQWGFSTARQKTWTLAIDSDDYYTIKSVYSGKYLGVDPDDTSIVRQYTSTSDYTKWSIELTSSGKYKLKCKALENTDYVLATPSATSGNGINLTMVTYTHDTNYRDEWECFENIYFKDLTIYMNENGLPQIQPNWAKEYLSRLDYTYSVVSGASCISVNSSSGKITSVATGTATVKATPIGSGVSYTFKVTVYDYPDKIQDFISDGYISYSDIISTDDGFTMITKSLSDILLEVGITSIDPSSKNTLTSSLYDDWYIYYVQKSSTVTYGLLKMREKESDYIKDVTDGDDPGVAISFLGFDINTLFWCLEIPNSSSNKLDLYQELENVIYPKEHTPVLSEYFKNCKNDAPYLIAREYTKFIASTAQNGRIYASDKYINAPYHVSIRLSNAINQINQESSVTIYNTTDNYIIINNPNSLTLSEMKAILITHTSNVSLYSFAAEIVFHADYADRFSNLVFIYDVYESAIKADMGIGEEKESGFSDWYYYNDDSQYVKDQKSNHNEEDYAN